jgi:integrase
MAVHSLSGRRPIAAVIADNLPPGARSDCESGWSSPRARLANRQGAQQIIEEIGVKRPGMANLTRAVMRRVLSFAIDMGLRTDNPFDRVPKYRLGTHHTWTDDEIATFENRWPIGTRQRLAFALLLYTSQRVGDVVRMRRSDIRGGTVHLVQGKTGAELHIDIHPALARAISAAPSNGLHLIGDRDGRPITSGRLSGLPASLNNLALLYGAQGRYAETARSRAARTGERPPGTPG